MCPLCIFLVVVGFVFVDWGYVCGKVGGCFGDFRFVLVFVVFFSLSLSLWIGSGRGCGKVGGRPTGGR